MSLLHTPSLRAPLIEVGCVHGRFQPFHNEHLEYVSRAFELCRLLYVGITHSIPGCSQISETAPHRHKEEANPLTYMSRMEMVLGALEEVGYDTRHVRIVPFPIESPGLITNYVPRNAIHLLSPCDEWQIEKYRSLTAAGYHAQFVISSRKGIQATSIRAHLRKGEYMQQMVPPFVARYLEVLYQEPQLDLQSAAGLFGPGSSIG